jgi:HK97 family phage major capsid protein/HK97 family phage prohead protease
MKATAPELQYRHATMERGAIDEKNRTAEISVSSDTPVERQFCFEILSHAPGAVDLTRLNSGACPVLVNHDPQDLVGVVRSARLDTLTRKVRAVIQFSASDRARSVWDEFKDGYRSGVSIGYRVIGDPEFLQENADGQSVFRANKWQIYEVSLAAIPADVSVGLGRSAPISIPTAGQTKVKKNILYNYDSSGGGGGGRDNQRSDNPGGQAEYARGAWGKSEAQRIEEIQAIATRMAAHIPTIGALANKAIIEGTELNEFRKIAFAATPGITKIQNPNPELGMAQRDVESYSIRRAIACGASGKLDGLEGEMDQEARKQYQANGWACRAQGPNSVIIPFDVLNYSKRDALVGTASLGGNVVATNLLAGSFIELLRVRMKVAALGATFLSGLVGNIAIPSQTGGATAYWAASEAAATTESSITFGQVTMVPKTVTARLDYSALLLQQSTPAIDNLIRMDLVNQIARAIDLASLHGSGASGQPTGVAGLAGIGSVTGGTNGAAATFANIIALETAIANANADGPTMGYLTNSRQRALLKQKLKNSTGTDASFIWEPGKALDGSGVMNGYRAEVSNNVSNTLTKGTSTTVCSAIFFADWSSLLIGQWGGLELLTNPYTQAANRIVEVYAYQFVDVNARHVENFAAMLDAL